jgi:polyhydroxybutyrate depolymerase
LIVALALLGCSAADREAQPDQRVVDSGVDADVDGVDADSEGRDLGRDAPDGGVLPTLFGGDRPTTLLVPEGYDPDRAYPLIITLHGYGQTGSYHLSYFGYAELVDSVGILVTAPEGSDFLGTRGWNSIPEMSEPDDAGYLRDLIAEIESAYNVDPERVFVSGHSAGGFMADRMACEHADQVRGIVVLNASTFYEQGQCSPARPVSVLHIHGTNDTSVSYDGGQVVPLNDWTKYPPVETAVERWAASNGCQSKALEQAALDLDSTLPGKETARVSYDCPPGVGVELWRMDNGTHIPQVDPTKFSAAIVDWLLASNK